MPPPTYILQAPSYQHSCAASPKMEALASSLVILAILNVHTTAHILTWGIFHSRPKRKRACLRDFLRRPALALDTTAGLIRPHLRPSLLRNQMASEEDVWNVFSYFLIFSGVVLALLELVIRYEIPYGRYSRPGFGFGVPPRLAWLLQESPAFIIPAWALLTHTGARLSGEMNANTVLLCLFTLHYFQR